MTTQAPALNDYCLHQSIPKRTDRFNRILIFDIERRACLIHVGHEIDLKTQYRTVTDFVHVQTRWHAAHTLRTCSRQLGGECSLVVVSTRHDLLARGAQQDGVLELSCVTSLDVAERRVGVHYALVAQVLESHGVARRARALQPPLAER